MKNYHLDNYYNATPTAYTTILENNHTLDTILEALYNPDRITTNTHNQTEHHYKNLILTLNKNTLTKIKKRNNYSHGVSGKKTGGAKTKTYNSVKQLTKQAKKQGISVSLKGDGHYLLKNQHGAISLPATPSDNRWEKNAKAKIKRTLKIKL